MTKTSLQHFLAGFRDELPILLGVIPFGMIYGILALSAGLQTAQAQAMSAIVFAGSSQFIAVQLIGAQTPALIILFTGFIINLRHALYSATLAPYLQHLPARWKLPLAYLLTDEAFAVSVLHYQSPQRSPLSHWYFLGAGLALWASWQASTAAGIFLGAQVPAQWGLDFTLALTFIALVIPALKDRPGIAIALAASLLALLFYSLPYKLGLIFSTLLAIGLGMWLEQRA
jgi:4-azaleucine resistance transporter AzlC